MKKNADIARVLNSDSPPVLNSGSTLEKIVTPQYRKHTIELSYSNDNFSGLPSIYPLLSGDVPILRRKQPDTKVV